MKCTPAVLASLWLSVCHQSMSFVRISQELARDPAAFRAKEKRLLGTLRELDVKLERLHKARDAALKK